MVTSYIGADVDCRMTELAVEQKGHIIARDRIPTNVKSLGAFLSSLPGRKAMVIEEGPMAGWLYRNLRAKVDQFGFIRAVTLFAYLDTPWRFGSTKKLWKYCGVGLKRYSSGSDQEGRPKLGYLRLFRGVNRRLKDVIMGAALSAISRSNNPFADRYRTMVQEGVTPSNARHTVARKMLTVMWGMWKTNSPYAERLVYDMRYNTICV